MALVKIQELSITDSSVVGTAAEVLAGAFTADPWISYIFPGNTTSRSRRISRFFTPTIKAALAHGKVFATHPEMVGVAVALGPGTLDLFDEYITQTGFPELRHSVGDDPFERAERHGKITQAVHRNVMPSEHWYLALLGVIQYNRRRGVGEALLRPILDQADLDGLGTYLETSQYRNLAFYERQGFAVVGHGIDDVGDLPYWGMAREPRTAAMRSTS